MSKLLIGYVGIPKLSTMTDEDIKALDVINLAFGHVVDGDVVCDMDGAVQDIEHIRTVNPEIRIVLSIGGWSAGGFSEAASTAEGRERFADTAAKLVKKYGLDGIDVDWEYPCISIAGIAASPEDKENFTLLLAETRKALDALGDRHYTLSIAGGGDGYYTRCTNLGEASRYLDYVQLMSYDLRGGFTVQTGHHTNLYSNQADLSNSSTDEGVRLYLEAGVPAEKLIVGAAFYSRLWKGVPDVNHGWMQMAQTTGGYGPDFTELKESYINKNGFVRYWDDEAKAPYLYDGDTFISYDDEQSLLEKVQYVNERGLGGIMYWEYSTDETGTLMRTLAKAMNKE